MSLNKFDSETFPTPKVNFEHICLYIHLRIGPRAQTPEMSTMGPYTMRYKRSVHRVAGGFVCGSCCVNICQNKLLYLSWEVSEERGDWKTFDVLQMLYAGL